MQAKSIRIPDEMLSAIEMVERKEHIEEATAIRKLIQTGLETYAARLYRQGQLSLREFAERLGLDLVEATDVLLDHGVKGNLDADDVLHSLEQFKV